MRGVTMNEVNEKIWAVCYHTAWLVTGLAMAFGVADFATVVLHDILHQLFFIDLRLPCIAFVLGAVAFAFAATTYVLAGVWEWKEEKRLGVKLFAVSLIPCVFNLFIFVTLASY